MLLAASLGVELGSIQDVLKPAWRTIRSWKLAMPPEFRAPAPLELVAAIALYAWVHHEFQFVVMCLLQFHCLLRPDEARNIWLSDIIIFLADEAARYSGVYGLVGVRKPKTRRLAAHAPTQHVLIEDKSLADFLGWLLSPIPADLREVLLWNGSPELHAKLWRQALAMLGCQDGPWTPASLRGGGATEHYLRQQNVPALRRRGRWTQEATLERYLQEGILLRHSTSLPTKVIQLSGLAASVLQPASSPPPPLLTPT